MVALRGYALYVKGGQLVWVYNFLGLPPEQRLSADAPGEGTHVVGVEFAREKDGEHGEALAIGYDSGDAVSSDSSPRFAFSGGDIVQVVYDVANDV